MDRTVETIQRKRMHGLYLSRGCPEITQLSKELLGLHSWFYRNVAFSALIRGADIHGWKNALVKTWLYRGTLHGAVYEELPKLLALHAGNGSDEDALYSWSKYYENLLGRKGMDEVVHRVIGLLEDGVYSRAEMRRIFAYDYEPEIIQEIFSSWGGIFVCLARQGIVAFRDMKSRDFDLIDAEPVQSAAEVLPELLHRYFTVYGPATLEDAALFFGFHKQNAKRLFQNALDGLRSFTYDGSVYYDADNGDPGEIPELTLLSGFDPLIVSYERRDAVLPDEYRKAVILKSGICLPTIAVNGRVAGIWNIKRNEPVVEFFTSQPGKIKNTALEMVDFLYWRTRGQL